MSLDRQQIRREAEAVQPNKTRFTAPTVLALLAELEQAEKSLVRERLAMHEQRQRAEQAERERDALKEMNLGVDDLRLLIFRKREAEARLAKVPALVEAVASALTSLGTGPLKDGYAYAVLTEALAAWEAE